MRLPKPLTILALLAALALFAAGCGGDDGDETTAAAETTAEAAPSLTKAELIEQGDGICAEVNAAVGTVATSAAETDTQISQTANLYTGMVESLEELGEPQEPQGYAEFIEAARQFAAIEDEIALATEREDTEALGAAATRAAPALEEFQSQAQIYGFEECSEGPSAPAEAPSGAGGGEEIEEGGVEVTPEVEEEVVPEEVAPEEVAPETGGAGGEVEEVAPEGGGTGAGGGGTEGGGGSESGGVGPG